MSNLDEPCQLQVLERCERDHNMARYYVLSVEPSLFAEWSLVREWGRIGHGCKRRVELHLNEQRAKEALDAWLARKLRRGYDVVA
jgi:predicted DNA-binding WGR domain protein